MLSWSMEACSLWLSPTSMHIVKQKLMNIERRLLCYLFRVCFRSVMDFTSGPESLCLVLGIWHVAWLDHLDVVVKIFIVAAHLLSRLDASHGAGHLVPPVGCALAIVGECLFKHLVLFRAPLWHGVGRGAPRGRHIWSILVEILTSVGAKAYCI